MLLADASFLVALLDPADQWRMKAALAAPQYAKRAPWRTHNLALGEVVAVIGSRRGGKDARRAYEMVRDTLDVVVPSLQEMDEAMAIVVQSDGALSLSDALLVLWAREGGAKAAILSFDSGFDTAGVKRLPR